MQSMQASQAKTHFLRLLDRVERGETVVITRHGKAVARICPEEKVGHKELAQAVSEMRALRNRIGRLSLEEILTAKNEGRA